MVDVGIPQNPADPEQSLRRLLALARLAPYDFALRIQVGEVLVETGETARALRVLRSCADYCTLAGFPVRALWALKIVEMYAVDPALVDRGLNLLATHYGREPDRVFGEAIFEMPLPKREPNFDDLPERLEDVIAELEKRATDILRGVSFPDRLPRFPLLSELDRGAFVRVLRSIRLRRGPAGTVLAREGESGTAVFLVVAGRVIVTKRSADGLSTTTLAELSEGEIFGEMALVTESPRVATVVADTAVELFEIPRSVLNELSTDAVQLQSALSRQVCDRMVNNLMSLSPVFRVIPLDRRAELLSRFKTRLVESEEDVIIEGQIGRGLFIILDGLVQVTLRKGGKRHLINWLREGDIFGEISLLRRTPATATCTASRRTLVMFLASEDFETIPDEFPEVVEKMQELGEFRLLDNIYTLA
ncbi:MAG: cyclic nucleotide-binding domain-containing protein [Myxococcales bacterium]|nr:cyclic nucleotide-binding domain-containing protein [Myxococcales bacterium]